MEYQHGLNMARTMKKYDTEIKQAIRSCTEAKWGVVGLFFYDHGNEVDIRILDQPYGTDVRVYPGE